MRYSKLFGKTLRLVPKEAEAKSHQLLLKAGFVDRALTSGIYTYLPLGWKVLKKIENIIREEMDVIGGQEMLLPALHPRELWEESSRWASYVPSLFKLKDQHGRDLCLAPTHEEAITDVFRRFVSSYQELSLALYQIQTKFRNEIRATGGLLRVREFIMKDLYSFHRHADDLDKYYQIVFEAYKKIFERCGVKALPVEASSGSIGGSFCHEFTYLGKAGEDKVIICSKCDYAANVEQAEGKLVAKNPEEEELPIEKIPAERGVNMELMAEFYKAPLWRLLKTIVYLVKGEPVAVIIRGDLEINEVKLEKVLGTRDFRIPEPEDLKNLNTVRGFVGPVDLPVARFLVDQSVLTVKNLITGANKLNFDLKSFNYPRDISKGETVDVANVKAGFFCPKCDGELKEETAIELGHVFKLGTKYSEKMQAYFTDEKGERKVVWMGCYGIGLGRLLAAITEANNDEKGIIWPKSVAPFATHLVGLDIAKADKVYDELKRNGVDVLYDDREISAGVKFADADLIGIPVRLVVSAKTGDKIEYKERGKEETKLLTLDEIVKLLNC